MEFTDCCNPVLEQIRQAKGRLNGTIRVEIWAERIKVITLLDRIYWLDSWSDLHENWSSAWWLWWCSGYLNRLLTKTNDSIRVGGFVPPGFVHTITRLSSNLLDWFTKVQDKNKLVSVDSVAMNVGDAKLAGGPRESSLSKRAIQVCYCIQLMIRMTHRDCIMTAAADGCFCSPPSAASTHLLFSSSTIQQHHPRTQLPLIRKLEVRNHGESDTRHPATLGGREKGGRKGKHPLFLEHHDLILMTISRSVIIWFQMIISSCRVYCFVFIQWLTILSSGKIGRRGQEA